MSWSISLVGTPSGVSRQIDVIAEGMTDGQSKDEFMEAKSHLQGLLALCVKQNVKLNANGHATLVGSEKSYGNVSVTLESFYGEWCE